MLIILVEIDFLVIGIKGFRYKSERNGVSKGFKVIL